MRKILILMMGSLIGWWGCQNHEKPLGPVPPPEFGTFALNPMTMPQGNPHGTSPSRSVPQDNSHEANVNQPPQKNSPPSTTAANSENSPSSIHGTIYLSPNLATKVASGGKVLFLIARSPEGGPPLAVKRLVVDQFPTQFSLGKENVMTSGTQLEGPLMITARLDRDGSAGPATSGDMEGTLDKPVHLGQNKIQIVIDKAY
jgi:hypothetical protein